MQQVIELEENVEMLQQENRVLKECMQGEGREIASSVVDAVYRKIDCSTGEILQALAQRQVVKDRSEKEAEKNRWNSLTATLSYTAKEAEHLKILFQEMERDISGLAHLCTEMSAQIREKNKQLKMYAILNHKLTAIKDEYIKSRMNNNNNNNNNE